MSISNTISGAGFNLGYSLFICLEKNHTKKSDVKWFSLVMVKSVSLFTFKKPKSNQNTISETGICSERVLFWNTLSLVKQQ